MAERVLRFELEDEQCLLYFLIDGTACILPRSVSGRRCLIPAEERGPVLENTAKLKPVQLQIGMVLEVNGRKVRLLDADDSTRRFYRQIGCPLAQKRTLSKIDTPAEDSSPPLCFFGTDTQRKAPVTVEYYTTDCTTRILRIGKEVVSRRKALYRFDGETCEPSWKLLLAAVKSRRPITIQALDQGPILLDGWDAQTETIRDTLPNTESPLSWDAKWPTLDTTSSLTFIAELTGLVRGRPRTDAERRLILSWYPIDQTLEVRFSDNGELLCQRGKYHDLRLSDLVRPNEIVFIATEKAAIPLFSLRLLETSSTNFPLVGLPLLAATLAMQTPPSVSVLKKELVPALAVATHLLGLTSLQSALSFTSFALRVRAAKIKDLRSRLSARTHTLKKHLTNLDTEVTAILRRCALAAGIPFQTEEALRSEALFSEMRTTYKNSPDALVDAVAIVSAAVHQQEQHLNTFQKVLTFLALRIASGNSPPKTLRAALPQTELCTDNELHSAWRDILLAGQCPQPLATRFYSKDGAIRISALCDALYSIDSAPLLLIDPNMSKPKSKASRQHVSHVVRSSTDEFLNKTSATSGVQHLAVPSPSNAVKAAQRAFATAFGRAHRHRQLRHRLVAQSTCSKLTEDDFVSAVIHILSEGLISLEHAQVRTLAAFAFGSSLSMPEENTLQVPCTELLDAVLALDGPYKLAHLHKLAVSRRLRHLTA